MPKPSLLDKYHDHLWDDLDTLDLTNSQRDQLMRFRIVFMRKLENPTVTNTYLADSLVGLYKISRAQAYRDIAQCEVLIAPIRTAEKSYLRYLVVETQKEAINIARENKDPDAMSRASAVIGKYARLDQEEQEPIPWEEIVPQPVEYVNDPTVLGLPEVKNPKEYVEQIKHKYIVEDVEYEDVR